MFRDFSRFASAIFGNRKLSAENRELLKVLEDHANAKADLFDFEIRQALLTAGSQNNHGSRSVDVPIRYILDSGKITSAIAQTDAPLAKQTHQVFKSFKSKKVPKYQEAVLSFAEGLLGTATAGVISTQRYCLVPSGSSIVRLDIKSWRYEVQSRGLKTKLEQVAVCVFVKSLVDTTRMTLDEFMRVYDAQLTSLTSGHRRSAIQHAKRCFELGNPDP